MKVLVFAAHPDDVEIGCGGTIAKHVEKGDDVLTVYMTSGESGSLTHSKKELAEIREKEAIEAGKVLGVKRAEFLRNPDGFLDYNKENFVKLISIIREERPDIVYVHHATDNHHDHKETNKLVLDAVKQAAYPLFQECKGEPWDVGTVLTYEVWTPLHDFAYVEDITEFIGNKVKALEQHRSQIKEIAFHKAAEGLARYRGVLTGKGDYCEVFGVVKIKKIS
jgi:LmbE family N-acetylglucosaminyl deacetylase